MDGEENAGTITSYDTETGKLTIALFGGETISGIVTEEPGSAAGTSATTLRTKRAKAPKLRTRARAMTKTTPRPGHDGTAPGASEGPRRGDDNAASCSPEDLVVGATVSEAELELEHDVATFKEIDLAP